MNQLVAKAIILNRTDYGEADRILTLLTPDHGKLRLLARGVRRVKSKLAGGIELFSVSHITFIRGRGDMGTLVSTRLEQHYGRIVEQLDRTMCGYELIKLLNKNTEDEVEPAYFTLLQQAFAALNEPAIPIEPVRCWFEAQLLGLAGHTPDLRADASGRALDAAQVYTFDIEQMAFAPDPNLGQFTANHIKFLRLAFAPDQAGPPMPKVLAAVQGADKLAHDLAPLMHTMLRAHLRV